MNRVGYLEPGSLLDHRYEIREEIGRGGFSIVYDALDRNRERSVALKLLVPPPAMAGTAKERLRREVQAVRTLQHPGIVPIFDLLDEKSMTCVVMERIEGGDLQTRVQAQGPLSVK